MASFGWKYLEEGQRMVFGMRKHGEILEGSGPLLMLPFCGSDHAKIDIVGCRQTASKVCSTSSRTLST